MATFAEGITSFDRRVAAHGSESSTRYGTHRSLRVGHRSERVGHRSERVAHHSPFVAMLSEDLGHPETDAGMRFELRVTSSLRLSHADLFVAMPDAIGAMLRKNTTDAPRRPSALPRARRASLRVARAAARARTQALPIPRDASRLPWNVPPAPCDPSLVPRDAPPAPCDPSLVPRDAPPVPRDAPRVRQASPPEASDAPPGVDHAAAEPRECRLVLRASRRARGHPEGTPRGALRALALPRPHAMNAR
jgi:hypothetical protein